ncbi:MAG: MBL fold metallo-hydrolase [Lysobacterales bacterium]
MSASLVFRGAAGEVTGSCHLLRTDGGNLLLDCGLIQGGAQQDRRNAADFGFPAGEIDALVLSHAHIDHCGRLPLLVRRGFSGPIYAQPATADLLRIMLEDSARLALADVEHQNRRRRREGKPLLEPLYDLDDVAAVHQLVQTVDYGERRELWPGLSFRFADAGHIIGACSVSLWIGTGEQTRKLVYSGDLGPKGSPFVRDPEPIDEADLVLLESTYGDRLHRRRADTITELGEIFQAAWHSGGNVLIPAFAVGRSQEILYWMAQHHDDWQLGRWRIYLDSPMAVKVIEVYRRHHQIFDREALADWHGPENPFRMPNLKLVSAVEESRALNEADGGAIIIAGSGMCNGGRIVHHLKHNLWKPQTHVVIAGYQAHGTLGRRLVEGAEHVQLFGERIRVKAKIHTIGGLSAHADQNGLSEWYGAIAGHPPVWLVHGEDGPRQALAERLQSQFGSTVQLARPGEVVDL